MVELLTVEDLSPFASIEEEKANAMIADAVALAVLNAPCLADDDPQNPLTAEQLAAAKAVLRTAVLRWNDSGSGAMLSQSMGPFGATLDTRQPRRSMFWPSEIGELQRICRGESGGVYAVDTAPAQPMLVHQRLGRAFDDPFDTTLNDHL